MSSLGTLGVCGSLIRGPVVPVWFQTFRLREGVVSNATKRGCRGPPEETNKRRRVERKGKRGSPSRSRI